VGELIVQFNTPDHSEASALATSGIINSDASISPINNQVFFIVITVKKSVRGGLSLSPENGVFLKKNRLRFGIKNSKPKQSVTFIQATL
jgi:hypothetical protein